MFMSISPYRVIVPWVSSLYPWLDTHGMILLQGEMPMVLPPSIHLTPVGGEYVVSDASQNPGRLCTFCYTRMVDAPYFGVWMCKSCAFKIKQVTGFLAANGVHVSTAQPRLISEGRPPQPPPRSRARYGDRRDHHAGFPSAGGRGGSGDGARNPPTST